jgi:hypothetical protein
MSDSAPSDSSTNIAANESAPSDYVPFGIDLVEITTRPGHAFFLAPELRWGTAGHEEAIYGAPLDRLFGEDANTYVIGSIEPEDIAAVIAASAMQVDPMVTLPGLADGLMLAHPDEAPLQVGALDDKASAAHLHETWTWDLDKGSWVFDHHV